MIWNNDTAQLAIHSTEREIFAEAMGVDETDLPGTLEGDEDDQTLEEPVGWDGEPLGIEEIAHRNIYGDSEGEVLTDRPVQYEYEMAAEAEIAARDEQLAEQQQYIAQLEAANDPQRQQRAAVQREEAHYQIIRDPEQTLNYVGAMQQELQRRELRDLQSSFERAEQEYGRDFHEAHAELQEFATRGRTDPNAAAEVRSIVQAPDPGYALMLRRHMVNSVRTMPPPFARGGRVLSSRQTLQPQSVDIADQDGGFGDESVENDIFNSAFFDSRDHPHHRDF